MIEIENVNPINKGSLLATCDVHIIPWKMTLKEIKVFEKGTQRWISMPSREFVNDAGEKKYIELITFDNEVTRNRFRQQVLENIFKFLDAHPNITPEDAIKITDEVPF